MGVNKRLFLGGDAAPAGQELRFDEFWAGYDDNQSNRAEFKQSGKIIDFNTYSEGQAVLNQNPQTSGKYYLEIKRVSSTGAESFSVFNRSSNTVYDVSPYRNKNPVDGAYGASLWNNGFYTFIGITNQTGFENLSLGDGDIVCMAVDVDNKTIWWGRRDGLSDTTITWNNGNPNTLTGGLTVTFVPSDVMVSHSAESSSKYSEFEVLDLTEMLSPPTGFNTLRGAFDSTLTENEANF